MTDEAIDALVRRFLDRSLQAQEWTHSAHLVVGAWHVHQHGAEAAIERLRDGIRALNQQHGTPESESRGYHETITVAYVRLLADALRSLDAVTPFQAQVRAILDGPLCQRDVLLRFWSRDVLMSTQARAGWVRPDLKELRLP